MGRKNCENTENLNNDSQIEDDQGRDDVTQGRCEPTLVALNIKAKQSSTPRELNSRTEVLSEKLENLIDQNQPRLKNIRGELKADNAEFFNVVASELSGECCLLKTHPMSKSCAKGASWFQLLWVRILVNLVAT